MPSPFDEVREEFDLMVRGITDNAFRLATEDKDAPQKWAAFISTSTVEADKQAGAPFGTTFKDLFDETVGKAASTSALSQAQAAAEARIADPREQIPPFTAAAGQTPAGPESPLGRILGLSDVTEPIVDPEFAERQGRRLPGIVGDIAGPVFGAGAEITTPLDIALMVGAAGVGGAAAAGLRGAGRAGRIAAGFFEPLAKTFPRALAAEAALGTGAVLGATQAGEALENAPTAVRVGGALAGGLAGGALTLVAPAAGKRVLKEAGELAARADLPRRATQAAGAILPERVVEAAFDEAFTLPRELARSRVNFGQRAIQFADDFDRALYIATSKKASKRRTQFEEIVRAELESRGLPSDDLQAVAAPLRERVRDIARSSTGDEIAVPSTQRTVERPIPTSGQATLEGGVVPAATEQDVADRLTKQSGFDLTPTGETPAIRQAADVPLGERVYPDTPVGRARQDVDLLQNDIDILEGQVIAAREVGTSGGIDRANSTFSTTGISDSVLKNFLEERGINPFEPGALMKVELLPEEIGVLRSASRRARKPDAGQLKNLREDLVGAQQRLDELQPKKPPPEDIPHESSRVLVRESEEAALAGDDVAVFDKTDLVVEQSPKISQMALRKFGFTPELFKEGLTRAQRIVNKFKMPLLQSEDGSVTGFAKVMGNLADPLVDPVYNVVRDVNRNAGHLKNVITARFIPRINKAFDIADNGTVRGLENVDRSLVGDPTIQDIAARLPRYEDSLTDDQFLVLVELQDELTPMGRALKATGDEFGDRPDIIEGGFYIPRGGQIFDDGSDLPRSISQRKRVRGAKPPQEKAAAWPSMGEAISNGHQYDSLEQAIGSLVTRTGNRIGDTFLQKVFLTAQDEFGQKIGLTAKELLIRDNKEIATKMAGLRKQLQKIKALIGNKNQQTTRIVDRFLDDPNFNDIAGLRVALRNTRVVQRGPRAGQNVAELNAALKSMDAELKAFKPFYDRALKSAPRNAGHAPIGEGFDFPQLNGRTFPERMAARMNELLKREKPDLSNSARGLAIMDQAQRIWKATNATLDHSGVAIQALVSSWDNPLRMAIAFPRSLMAFAGPGAYADWATRFNMKVARQGGFSIEELAGFGLAQTNQALDVSSSVLQAGFGIPKIGRAIGSPFRGADRMFSVVGDTVRAEHAYDLVLDSLASGMSKELIITSGRIREITDAANIATGFVDGNFTIPNLVMFSARFFSARLKQIFRAARGIDIDAPLDLLPIVGGRIQRKIPKLNRFARDRDRYARRAILRMIGFGTMLTVAVNHLNGHETDFQIVKDGRYNSNFIRIRGKTRDYSVFGPMDSMLRMFVNAGLFRAKDTFQSITNSPIINAIFELFANEKFGGAPIFNSNIRNPSVAQNLENAARWPGYMAEQTLPFAADEATNIIGDAWRDRSDPAALANDIGVMLGEIIGAKSSQFSRSDIETLMRDPRRTREEKRHLQDILDSRREDRNRFPRSGGGASTTDAARDVIGNR